MRFHTYPRFADWHHRILKIAYTTPANFKFLVSNVKIKAEFIIIIFFIIFFAQVACCILLIFGMQNSHLLDREALLHRSSVMMLSVAPVAPSIRLGWFTSILLVEELVTKGISSSCHIRVTIKTGGDLAGSPPPLVLQN